MAKIRKSYLGGAASTTTSTSIASSGTNTFNIAAYTGWPYGTPPFFVVLEPGTANEEKVLVTRSGATDLTVSVYTVPSVAANRGLDGTSAVAHTSGSTTFPVFTAIEADEANELVSTMTTKGDLLSHGTSTFARLGVGTDTYVLKADSAQATGLVWGQVAAGGIATDAVTTAKIQDSAVTSAKIADGAIMNIDINGSAGIVDTKLATISTASKVSNSATTATDANTASAIVARDASGNFTAGTITATTFSGALSGNADTATSATTATTAGTVTTPAQGAITSVGTLSALTVTADVAAATFTGSPSAATTTTAASGVGYMGIPRTSTAGTTGDYTIVAADAGTQIYSVGTRTITIPANATLAMPIGTTIVFVNNSAGLVTITVTTDSLNLADAGTSGSRTLGNWGMATLVKYTTAGWIIRGEGLT